MFVEENLGGLNVEIEYNTDLFEQVTISRMFERFQDLLKLIVTDPHQKLSTLKLGCGMLSSSPDNIIHTDREELVNYFDQSNLTEHQLLIWLWHKLNPSAVIYNNAFSVIIPAKIELNHFQKAFETLFNFNNFFF